MNFLALSEEHQKGIMTLEDTSENNLNQKISYPVSAQEITKK